ncbi:hypothetical protein D3C80_1752730 [compost metagenome]
MRANHRVQQRRMFRYRRQPALMLFFRFTEFIFLERFPEIVLCTQATQQLLKRLRKCVKRRNAAGP